MNFVEKLFSKDGLSSMRWTFVWTYGFVIVVVFGSWAVVYIWTKGAADIPLGVAGLAGTALAIVTGGKYGEKREEVKKDAVVPESKEPIDHSARSASGSPVGR